MLSPRLLSPGDLTPLRAVVGEAALEYVQVLASFHFINRIADLLHVETEALPESLRRFESLRRVSVRVMGWLLSWMDLGNRRFEPGWRGAVESLGKGADETLLEPLRARPQMIEVLRLGREEHENSSLDPTVRERVVATVEASLPATEEEATGFHPRPQDPIECLAFVGTRYPARTTPAMISALRDTGFDDLGILDLAVAVAEANGWAREWRLLDLEPELFSTACRPRPLASATGFEPRSATLGIA